MPTITDSANVIFRDLESPGSPLEHKPPKPDIRGLFALIDGALATIGLTGAVTLVYETEAELAADLDHDAETLALVYGDADAAKNGFYLKEGASGAGSWTLTALAVPANFATLLSDLETAITEVDDRLESGEPGSYYAQTSPPGGEYRTLNDLSLQPSFETDLSASDTQQLLIPSDFTNPTTRITTAVIDGRRRVRSELANVFHVAAMMGRKVNFGDVISESFQVDTTVGSQTNWGFGFTLQTDAPTLGGPIANMSAAAQNTILRANGAMASETGVNGVAYPGVTFSDPLADYGWTGAEVVTATFAYTSPDEDAARMTFEIDDVKVLDTIVAPVIPDAYIGPVMRLPGVGAVAFYGDDLTTFKPSAYIEKNVYIDPDVGSAGGTGTEKNPWRGPEVVADFERDSMRGEYRILFKSGLCEDFGANFNLTGRRALSLVAGKGSGTILRGAITIPVGAPWQLVSGSVYAIENPGRPLNIRGIVEVGRTQSFGLAGTITMPDYIYAYQANDLAAASLQPGQNSGHITGTWDGFMLVRMVDDGDPADSEWRICSQSSVLSFVGGGDYPACDVDVIGLTVENGWAFGMRHDTVNLRDWHDNLVIGSVAGFGVDFKDCSGHGFNSLVRGCRSDLVHWNDTAFTDPDVQPPKMRLTGIGMEGGLWDAVTPADGCSPHLGNEPELADCWAVACGKDGFSFATSVRGTNLRAEDNYSAGISLAMAYADLDVHAELISPRCIGNNVGITLNGAATANVNGLLDIWGNPWLEGNVLTHLRTEQKGTGGSLALTALGPHYHNAGGVGPSAGDTDAVAGSTLDDPGATSST